jgi:antitoxin (DNA-binding transcriptional repressor) of toxin-antitoxin stability system
LDLGLTSIGKSVTLSHMKVVNIRELHERTGALVDLAAEGQVVVVTRYGSPLAELRPVEAGHGRGVLPDRTKLLARYPRLSQDSGKFLEEDRS